MECQRCLTGKEAKYRIYSDIIDMKVCAACADETRRLGLDLPLNLLRTGSKKTADLFAPPSPRSSVQLEVDKVSFIRNF